ncbi:hypothetical protein ACLOAV_010149 [Pseudogymnoascus australis]
MDSIKQGANYVSEHAQNATSGTSKEATRKSPRTITLPWALGNHPTTASAARDALGDKIDESKHDGKAEGHKQQI